MRAGMERLLELLHGQHCDLSEQEWGEVLALAEAERVLPWVAAHVGDAVPAAVGKRVAEIEREEWRAAFFWCAELNSVLQVFHEEGIPVVLLKGPSLAQRLYGDAALRPCRDLDLLVAREDWQRAEEALAAIGFVPMREMDDYHRPWQRQTTKLELHYDVENSLAFDFHVGDALKRARATEFLGERCLLLAPEDELLYLCLHAARHRYDRLGLVLDLRLGFERLGVDPWQPRPEGASLNGLAALGLLMVRRLEPELRAAWRPEVSEREWRHLEGIADSLWAQLLAGRVERGGWNEVHAFYLELEPTRWRRLKRRVSHARILASRTINRDREFAARFGLRREWQVKVLRPVRLIGERLLRRG